MTPSSSISPIDTCYWIVIVIDYDDRLEDICWKLWRLVNISSGSVKLHSASEGDNTFICQSRESISLPSVIIQIMVSAEIIEKGVIM